MVKITFIQPDNSEQVVECEPGMTLMEAAKLNSVPGIEAEIPLEEELAEPVSGHPHIEGHGPVG